MRRCLLNENAGSVCMGRRVRCGQSAAKVVHQRMPASGSELLKLSGTE